MKTFLGILFTIISISVFGQFPTPINFQYSYNYIHLHDSDFCNGESLNGPDYCSNYSWHAPDLNSTNSTLKHYNIYFSHNSNGENSHIITTTTNSFISERGIIVGYVWVTAVYTNPEGESEPSNIESNFDIPISVNENHLQNELNVFYDNKNQEIVINDDDISQINIINCNGVLINSYKTITNNINIEYLPKGFYIIVLLKNNQEVIRYKIVK